MLGVAHFDVFSIIVFFSLFFGYLYFFLRKRLISNEIHDFGERYIHLSINYYIFELIVVIFFHKLDKNKCNETKIIEVHYLLPYDAYHWFCCAKIEWRRERKK